MFKGKVDNFKKSLVKAESKDGKKSIENLVVLAIVLVVTVIAINYIWKGDKKSDKTSNIAVPSTNIIEEGNGQTVTNNDLEARLTNILSAISGVRRS